MTGYPDDHVRAEPYPGDQRAAVYRVIGERRDVRRGFLPDPVPDEVLGRVLAAAHQAPSVGLSQPWDFILITELAERERIAALARRNRDGYAATFRPYGSAPLTSSRSSPSRYPGQHRRDLRRHSWRAAHAGAAQPAGDGRVLQRAGRLQPVAGGPRQGLGIGWVSFFAERELAAELGLPAHLQVVAYLCAGYVREFGPAPELQVSGWAQRRPVAWAVHEGHTASGASRRRTVDALAGVIAAIRPLDAEAVAAARERLDRMTKPPGSLGVLEDVAASLAGLAGQCPPPLPEPVAVRSSPVTTGCTPRV